MISIYGDNDDRVVVESDIRTQEIEVPDGESVIILVDGRLEVDCTFVGPCWSFGFTPTTQEGSDELYSISILPDTPWSQIVEIEAPEDTDWRFDFC